MIFLQVFFGVFFGILLAVVTLGVLFSVLKKKLLGRSANALHMSIAMIKDRTTRDQAMASYSKLSASVARVLAEQRKPPVDKKENPSDNRVGQ